VGEGCQAVTTLVVATGNAGKLREFELLLNPLGLALQGLREFPGLPDVVEDGLTFEDNARIKAETIRDALDTWVLADDSGLVVDALGGAPGVHSARYAGRHGDDRANNEKLLAELEAVPDEARTARFQVVLALARPGRPTVYFEGTVEGRIGHDMRGSGGFGYDVLFLPQGRDVTTAEIPAEEKARISHRGVASRKLLAFLEAEMAREQGSR